MSKNTKIFLVVFTIFLIVVTITAIYYKNSHKENDESHVIIENGQKTPEFTELANVNTATKGATLEDTYSTNGLTYKFEDTVDNEVKVKLVKISGLKNETVQNNINNEIKERISKILVSNNFKNNSDDTAYVTTSVEANFSDVLSIKIFVQFSSSFSKTYGLNYRLDTGEKLEVGDLFIYNTPKKNIITESAYKTFAMNYYTDEGIKNEFYTNVDGEVLDFLIDYNNGKITEFTFNNYTIELYREGKTVVIDMQDYCKYIDIYSIFVSSSNLYEDDDIRVKNIPIFMIRPKDVLYDLYEKVNDTCIIDVIIYTDEQLSTEEKKVVETYKKDFEERLSVVKEEKNVYYSNYIKVTRGTEINDEKVLNFEENECYAVADEGAFLETIYNPILGAERNKYNVGNSTCKIYVLDEELLHSISGIIKYSMLTGEEYVEPEPEPEEENEEDTENEDDENSNDNNTNTVENQTDEANQNNTSNTVDNTPAANVIIEH